MVKRRQDGASNAVQERLVHQTSPCVVNRMLSAVRTTGWTVGSQVEGGGLLRGMAFIVLGEGEENYAEQIYN